LYFTYVFSGGQLSIPTQHTVLVCYIIQYAHKVMCVDATHGTNAYRFKLITVMVADDYGEGNYKNNDTIFTQIVL